MSAKLVVAEVCWCWREMDEIDGEARLLIPEADPQLYESPFDLFWDSREEAINGFLEHFDYDPENFPDSWVLCQETTITQGTVANVITPEVLAEL